MLPSVHVGAHVIEAFAVYLDVQWRIGWSVQDSVENNVFAYTMREEEACDYAFVDDV